MRLMLFKQSLKIENLTLDLLLLYFLYVPATYGSLRVKGYTYLLLMIVIIQLYFVIYIICVYAGS